MFNNRLRVLLIIAFLSVCIFAGFFVTRSQNTDPSYSAILQEYQRADSFYNEATRLSLSDSYNEVKEAALNENALKIFQSLLVRIPARSDVFDSLRFFTAFKTGELEHYFDRFSLAIDNYFRAIYIQKNSRLPDSLLFKPYLYAGIIYYNRNNYDTAVHFFNLAENLQAGYGKELQETERLYNLLGVVNYEKGDYKQAGNYFLKAIETLPKSHPYYLQLLVNYRINLAQIHFRLEEYDQANTMYQELLQTYNQHTDEINHNLGMIHLRLGAGEKALEHFRKVIYENNKVIRLYNSMGEAFALMNLPDSARHYYQLALNVHELLETDTDPLAHGQTLKNLGDLHRNLNQPIQALNYFQRAMHYFYPSFQDSSVRSDPEIFSGVFSYINLFNTLLAKAESFHLLYLREKNLSFGIEELEAYQSAFRLIDYVERTYNSDEARLFIDRIKYVVHGKPIDIAFELYSRTQDKKYLEDLYLFDQQNKASVLALNQHTLLNQETKDSVLLKEQASLRSEITRLSLKAAQIKDSVQITALNKSIRDLEISLEKVEDDLPEQALPVNERIPSVADLQDKLLNDHTALLSFHLAPGKLTTLVITKSRLECHQDSLPADFHEQITSYFKTLEDPGRSPYEEKSRVLYDLLFTGIGFEMINRLIIIPDDELNFLSFESLQNEKGEFLVQNYSVQYQYSTALLKKDETSFSDHKTLAFAPFAHTAYRDSLLDLDRLPNSLKEIESLKGEKYLDEAATKKTFLDQLENFRVLHLATHAVVNEARDSLSFIAFAPGENRIRQDFLLYEEEIYHLPLENSRLVILSACETGGGDLVKGEGVMSLSRAFTYAGCPNIITTLWNANDFSTSYLTNKLHHYLDRGHTIDRALQQAKLDYLKDPAINPRLKHPFYWSHLIFAGNYTVKASTKPWGLYLSIGLLLLAGVAYFLNRKKAGREVNSQ